MTRFHVVHDKRKKNLNAPVTIQATLEIWERYEVKLNPGLYPV